MIMWQEIMWIILAVILLCFQTVSSAVLYLPSVSLPIKLPFKLSSPEDFNQQVMSVGLCWCLETEHSEHSELCRDETILRYNQGLWRATRVLERTNHLVGVWMCSHLNHRVPVVKHCCHYNHKWLNVSCFLKHYVPVEELKNCTDSSHP